MAVIGGDGLSLLVGDGAATEGFIALRGLTVIQLEISQRGYLASAVAAHAWQQQVGTANRQLVLEAQSYATDEAPALRLRTLAMTGDTGNFKLELQGAEAMALSATLVLYQEQTSAGGYFGPIWESYASQRQERAHLARELAGVLDQLKGNHSVGALYSVKQGENELIFAQRKRMATIANTTNLGNWIDLGINAGANLTLDVKRFHSIWTEKANVTEAEMKARALKRAKELELQAETGAVGDASQGKHLLGLLVNSSVPQLADRVKRSGEHKLKNGLQPYSALEMILELNKQVSSKPDARSFDVPRGFQSKGARESYPLEEYLMRICIQHQKDMADIDPEHSEIREALRDDLAEVVKPIAAAIRKGDLSTMALVRLIGEGKIIKKHGRAIADPQDVIELIKHEAPRQSAYAPVNPAEYYQDVAFSRAQLKAAIKSLDGDEKLSFTAMFPDTVLAEAGMD
jgi:hypothetical protein